MARCHALEQEFFRNLLGQYPRDGLHTIQRPDRRGSLILGRKGDLVFGRISDRYLQGLGAPGFDFDSHAFAAALKEEFVDWIRNGRDINEETVEQLLAAAELRNRFSHVTLTHHIPCSVVFPEVPADFEVGLVKFRLMQNFLAANEEQIGNRAERSRGQGLNERVSGSPGEQQAAPPRDMLFEELKAFFPTFRWVASVAIPKCDSSVSKQRAQQAVQSSLDLLKLFLTARLAAGIRHALRLGHPPNRTELTQDEAGEFHISWSRKLEDAHVEPNWYAMITTRYQLYWDAAVEILGSSTALARPRKLHQRFLDALAWYGDAVSEQMQAGRLVKFVAALERVTITSEEPSGGHKVARRAAILASEGSQESFQKYFRVCQRIHGCRSNLMHGSLSPLDRRLPRHALDAEHVSRRVLFSYLRIVRSITAEEKVEEKWLGEQYARLEKQYPKA